MKHVCYTTRPIERTLVNMISLDSTVKKVSFESGDQNGLNTELTTKTL